MTGRVTNWERHLGWLVLAWQVHGGVVDLARVGQWREGRWVPSYDDLAEAEQVAALPPKAITSLAGLLHVPVVVPDPRPDRADALLHAALHEEATAAQWSDLARLIRKHPEVAPRGPELEDLILRLLNALPRGVKHAYRLMRVAALDVAAVPQLCDKVVEGIRVSLQDVDGPAFLEPIGLLDQLSAPEARGLILDLMERPRSRPQRRYAAGLAAQVLLRGAFDEAERARVVMHVLSGWRADPVEAEEDLGQIVDALPPGLSTVLEREPSRWTAEAVDAQQGARDRSPEEGAPQGSLDNGPPEAAAPGGESPRDRAEDVADAQASRVSEQLSADLLARGHPEAGFLQPMLHELLRQALFFRNMERRLRAGQVLSSSPLAPALAECVLDLLAAPDVVPTVRRRATALLGNVVGERHVLRMLPLVRDSDVNVAASVTTAFGHTSYSEVADLAIRQNVPDEWLPLGRACLYALGMTGSPGIPVMASSRNLPKWQRHTAAWWHEHGTAIHE